MKESDIQRTIIDYLNVKKIFHFRNNSGALPTLHGGFIRFGAVGSPDIIAVVKGTFVGIEVKNKTGKQSPAQKDFQERLEAAGGRYILAKQLEDVSSVL